MSTRSGPGDGGNVKASVFITSFSFASYVAARINRAARAPGGLAIPGASERLVRPPGRVSQAVVPSACRIPGRRAREPDSVSLDGRYRAARREPVPRRRV